MKLLVVGSVNGDRFIKVSGPPAKGETIKGSMTSSAGGKGANQAVCARRLGADTQFAALLGDDSDGNALLQMLKNEQVDMSLSKQIPGVPTGTALIFSYPDGDNSIVIIGGANDAWLDEAKSYNNGSVISDALNRAVLESGIILLQREIPHEINVAVAKLACENKIPVVLDVGGEDKPLDSGILKFLHVISPNETELARITGMPTETNEDVAKAAQHVLSLGVENVLVKLGSRGSIMFTKNGDVIQQSVFPVAKEKIVDTTGAGDCFTAAFSVGLSRGSSFKEAMNFASVAASLCIQTFGAMPSMPYLEMVQSLLK
jgi:ribokinase